jgi:cell division protein FtsN
MGRFLPAVPSRIFKRKPSLASRMLRAMLALAVLVTLATLGSGLFLERTRPVLTAAPGPASPAVAAAATANPAPAPAPAVENAPSVRPEAPAETSAAGSVSAASGARGAPAALETPVPPALGDTGDYWVEYGVFAGDGDAQRVQQALANQGLSSVVVVTHMPDGRVLLRVRSVVLADHDEASEVAARAQRALGIGTLVHGSAGETAPVPVAPTAASTGAERYWVQFGAFLRAEQAQQVRDALGESGIDAAVSPTHDASGRPLFRVRSALLPDRDSALALARRGHDAAKVDFLIGRSADTRRAAIAAREQRKPETARQ